MVVAITFMTAHCLAGATSVSHAKPSSRVGKGLAEKILGELEPDIDAWYEWLREEERRKGKRMIGGNGHG
jgi:hypothetical protein